MTKNHRNPHHEDDRRCIAQWTAQVDLEIALERNDMEAAQRAFDVVCDYTAARVVARKSRWLPVQPKGE